MKKNKKILSILLAITMLISIFSITASAAFPTSGTCGDNISWSFDGSTLTISGTGNLKNIYQYKPDILPYAGSIVTVVIENGVTSIAGNAFAGCKNLERVIIPVSVKEIQHYAFGYTKFKDIYYEGTRSQWYDVELIERTPLDTFVLDYVKVHYECKSGDFEYSVISETKKTIKITDYKVIPARYDKIEPYDVEIPSEINGYTVTEIGDYAFYDKSKISAIELPSTVTKIGEEAFRGCTRLNSITLPDGLKEIGDGAFYNCDGIKEIIIPDSVTTIGNYAFYDCDGLKEIKIPDGVTTIGNYTFYDCDSLETVIIGANLTTIGDYAFRACDDLKAINVDSENQHYTSDENGVLFNKDRTTLIQYPIGNTQNSYLIPDTVTTIGGYAFYYCWNLKEINIPDSVTTIGNWAFGNCDSLETVIIGDGVTTIGDSAFRDCDNLNKVEIPDSVKSIDVSAFRHCNGLKTVIIGDSVTTIGDYAFYYCNSLKGITIPDGVKSIGQEAFYDCDNLTDVYFIGTEEQWEAISIGSNNSPLTNATIHFDHKNNHTPADGVAGIYTAPTCTEKGYTTYTCSECGMEFKDDYVNATGHDCSDVLYVAPPCTQKGYTIYECHCGVSVLRDFVDITGHIDSENDGICDQCNKNLNPSTTDNSGSDISGISGIFSIFTIIAELFEKLFSLFGFMSV